MQWSTNRTNNAGEFENDSISECAIYESSFDVQHDCRGWIMGGELEWDLLGARPRAIFSES